MGLICAPGLSGAGELAIPSMASRAARASLPCIQRSRISFNERRKRRANGASFPYLDRGASPGTKSTAAHPHRVQTGHSTARKSSRSLLPHSCAATTQYQVVRLFCPGSRAMKSGNNKRVLKMPRALAAKFLPCFPCRAHSCVASSRLTRSCRISSSISASSSSQSPWRVRNCASSIRAYAVRSRI